MEGRVFFSASFAVGRVLEIHDKGTHKKKKTDCVTDFTLQFGNKKNG